MGTHGGPWAPWVGEGLGAVLGWIFLRIGLNQCKLRCSAAPQRSAPGPGARGPKPPQQKKNKPKMGRGKSQWLRTARNSISTKGNAKRSHVDPVQAIFDVFCCFSQQKQHMGRPWGAHGRPWAT